MTTIAYKAGVMSADTGSRAGDARQNWAQKLAKGPDGTLYGVTGNAAECFSFLCWVNGGCIGNPPVAEKQPESRSSFLVLAAPPVGDLRLVTAWGDESYGAAYFSVGYDSGVAYGALFAGADAVTAIEAAIEHGTGTSGKAQSISHGGS